MKKALIPGITGQDGYYLAEFLLSKGYEVHDIIRKSSTFNTSRIQKIYKEKKENILKKSKDEEKMWKYKKILVTAAGDFMGSHVARELYQQGNFVRAVDIKRDGYMEEPYYSEKLTLDLRVWENCLKATKNIDYIYPFAADMRAMSGKRR